jgi:hypothetical protein
VVIHTTRLPEKIPVTQKVESSLDPKDLGERDNFVLLTGNGIMILHTTGPESSRLTDLGILAFVKEMRMMQ